MQQCTKYSHPRAHLTFDDRVRLEADWRRELREHAGSISISAFARRHGISRTLWRRELARCGNGRPATRRIDRRRGTRAYDYAEYSAQAAQADAERRMRDKGPRVRTTAAVARFLSDYMRDNRASPYAAVTAARSLHPEWTVPSERTLYNLIYAGDLEVGYGDTPYHPGRRRPPRPRPHAARTVPGRTLVTERPAEADARTETGHLEMDTVVSGRGGAGGVLALYDRASRRYLAEPIGKVSQFGVLLAIRRLRRRGLLGGLRTITTDNGCEFLDQGLLERALGCGVYYTHAYASYEKGGVENGNRLFRRWFPKGTDFSKVSPGQIRDVLSIINNMPRKSLKGKCPNDYYPPAT